jgi:CDP-glucose 4,6-dehydratase
MTTFWQGKKVLITGHTGFKGSWLSLWLQSLGANVIGYALKPATMPNHFKLADVQENMTSVIGDINDLANLSKTVTAYKPEIIFHMAAQSLVRSSFHDPVDTYNTNVLGTVKVLEAARHSNTVKTIVNVTTDKCYENQEWHYSYRETDRLGGFDPYSNSKACAELVTDAYRKSFFQQQGIGCATVRAGNVIGGGDWANERLVPDAMRACLENTPLIIRYPNAVRPWQHVLEPLWGYMLLAERLNESPVAFSEGWNFGPDENDAKPVSWIADFIGQHWTTGLKWQHDKSQHLHEANLLRLDCAKAKARLHWQPRWDLATGLQKTISWYKAFQARQNIRTVTLGQIEEFMQHKYNVPLREESACVSQ